MALSSRLIELSQHLETLESRVQYVTLVGIKYFSRKLELFASRKHGWGEDDGGTGVTYPGDLDEYSRVTLQDSIPDGCVRIYGFWGREKGGFEDVIDEAAYLATLAKLLDEVEA